jgi:hypothetical protein
MVLRASAREQQAKQLAPIAKTGWLLEERLGKLAQRASGLGCPHRRHSLRSGPCPLYLRKRTFLAYALSRAADQDDSGRFTPPRAIRCRVGCK